MKTACVAALATVATASAFMVPSTAFSGVALSRGTAASSVTSRTNTAVQMTFAGGLIGADGPEPNSKNFDPLHLAENNPENVLFYREAEIKHCRIAMLAVVGMIVPNFVRVPGDIYQGVSVVDAHNAMVEKGPMWQLLFWISLMEILTTPAIFSLGKTDREPGDFNLDPLNFCKDPEKKARYQLSELKNGRLAMFAFSGMITQAALTGHGFPYLN